MGFSQRFIQLPDGLRIALRDYPAEGGERGLPVFCIHGLTRNSADFEGVAPALAGLGRRVLAIDVRGRGRSDWDADPSRYRPDVYVGDVLAVLDDLAIERAVFVGTSMGGLITMLLAVAAPQRIAGAVLNDVGPVVDPAGLARIASYVGKVAPCASWEAMTQQVRTIQASAFPDADEAFWKTFAHRTARQAADGQVVLDYDPACARIAAPPADAAPPDLTPLFAALAQKPVLVVRGELSDILAPQGVEAMRRIKPDLEVVEVPRVGHAPTLEEPAARRALEAFVSRLD